ncbi:MAG: hypothetical protein IAI49_16515 [Candidatus Eremiobacteraeota bacterium]|nr:hypothetical protein [Candidatus Eremiobacteraeota bacterium]
MRLGRESDALVLASVALRTRFEGFERVEVPSRRNFWYGHALVLDREPEAAEQPLWIARHAELFRGISVQKHTIVWERGGVRDRSPELGPNVRGELERSIVFVRRTPFGAPRDSRVRRLATGADWDAAAALAACEEEDGSAEMRSFARWRFDVVRADALRGHMSMNGLFEAGELVAFAGVYANATVARFATPVTRQSERGRGLFRALCTVAVDDALRAHPEAPVVIFARAGDPPETIYRRIGFDAVGEMLGLLGEPEGAPGNYSSR